MNGQFSGRSYRNYNQRGGGSTKTKSIEQAIERREKSIRGFADAKSVQIAVSSAFNGSVDIVVAMLGQGIIQPDEFWEEQDKWYYAFLKKYNQKQDEANQDTQEETRDGVRIDTIANAPIVSNPSPELI